MIVALLCLTLCVDTAKACWWRRHHTTVHSCNPALQQQPRATPIGTPVCCLLVEDSVEVVVDHHGHPLFDTQGFDTDVVVSDGLASEWVDEQVETSAEPAQIVHGREEPNVAEQPAPAADTVVVHAPTFVVEAAPASPAVLPNPVVSQEPLRDLQPATTPSPNEQTEPAAPTFPATPATADTAAEPEEPVTTQEANLFDLYDDTDENAASGNAALPADEAATEDVLEAGEAPPEPPASTEASPDAAFFTPDEPMRRWTNEAGTHQAQGWLVELRADRVRILKVNGRHTTVARESLSAEDRAYVSAVSDRLAADRQSTATATAGL